ncbi:hypothetical protein [Amycolatopsis sp. NBC_01286]|uniref:hypothetical protein n=1 Tax=Amycolatopsis sp. NBC_01286 TaxID=2903560 RepID=UPI002E154004|nr:hypothetical protein OG570_48150 [Amycolatopsis sp. NBC_01286]
MNYPQYPDAQTVVITDDLARPADVADDLAALDVADIRAVRDDATREIHADDAEHDLRIALLSLLAAEKNYRGRDIPEFADAAAGLRHLTAFLINTVHG